MMTADAFDKQRFVAIIERMVKAERILVIGLRGAYPLAYYLSFYLKMVRDRVTLIGQAGHTLAEDLSVLDAGDLLIAISFNPYTKDTVDACRACKRQGVDIVAVTDSLSSPLALETDNFLINSVQGDYFFSPIAAAVICIETLLSELLKHFGAKAIDRLNRAEHVLGELGAEF